jgi:hypothetical protein
MKENDELKALHEAHTKRFFFLQSITADVFEILGKLIHNRKLISSEQFEQLRRELNLVLGSVELFQATSSSEYNDAVEKHDEAKAKRKALHDTTYPKIERRDDGKL